jgi:histidinol dehydrogenase
MSETKINRYVLSELTEEARQALMRRVRANHSNVEDTVRSIIDDVRRRGDAALVEHTARLDNVSLPVDGIRVTEEEFRAADKQLDPALGEALRTAIANIHEHHKAQIPRPSWMHEVRPGVIAGERWTPIASVGLYVPRGKGSFPSVMTMLCTPAVLAGVPEIAVCTPPGENGTVDAASLVAARLCGVSTVYKVGGAQAIAALAYGTDTVRRVEKIVGPGNQYVSAAKRVLYGEVDPGPPAGPSESIIFCDGSADPELAARELLVEAEHGPDSAALLVTHVAELADAVAKLIPGLLAELPPKRRGFCEQVLAGYGGIVHTADVAESVAFINEWAPEHLRVLVANPFEMLPRILHAGEVLLGENTSIPYGNFAIGVNAILPTGGMARSQSSVGVLDFMKRSGFSYVTDEGAAAIGPIAVALATYEDFPAHASAAQHVLDRIREKPAGR